MAQLELVIGNKNYSSWSLRPWLVLKAAGLSFQERFVRLYEPDTKAKILAINPAGKLPALISDGLVIADSLAIAEYVAELAPDARLWPNDRTERARARAIVAEMHAGFAALRNHCPMNIRGSFPDRVLTPEVEADLARIQEIWRTARAAVAPDAGPFLFGTFGIADAFYAPVVTRCLTYGVALDPVSAAYCAALMAHPAMQTWVSDAKAEPWRIASSEF